MRILLLGLVGSSVLALGADVASITVTFPGLAAAVRSALAGAGMSASGYDVRQGGMVQNNTH